MKLVLLYNNSDGCTYSCDVVRPVEYESPEQALIDFEKAARDNHLGTFEFGGWYFSGQDFFFHKTQISLPEILTIDQWFNSHGAGAHG